MRRLAELPCIILHRLWWVPLWNRSYLLSCPIGWLTSHSTRFRHWFWEEPV